jgi:hypothetical protein
MGRANYWTLIPFAGLMCVLLVFGLIWPHKVPAPPGQRRWSPTAIRIWFGLVLVVIVAFAIPSMLREARNDPNCERPGTATGQTHQPSDSN